MGVNKVVFNTAEGEQTLIDLTSDNVTADAVFHGATFHGADGEVKTGTFTISEELTEQDSLIDQIKAALANKAAGGSGLPTQEKTVEITENGTVEVAPDEGYTLSKVGVTVNVPIPEGYIQPSGTLEVTENGEHDVSQYAAVNVNVASSAAPDPRDQYQRVEYIESATEGTYPYIITDICADNDTGVEVVASFPILQDRIPMGSREDSGSTRFYCIYPLSASTSYYGFNGGYSLSGSFAVNTKYRCQTNFRGSRMAGIFGNDGTRESGGLISVTLTTQTAPISIFGYHSASSGSVTSKREYRLYAARISQGFEVIREYIPCYRKSDGVVGLYEMYTDTFLTNADADGDGSGFAKGADIDW